MAAKKITRRVAQSSEKISEGKKRRLANLKPFPKGVSGNPGGRPKSRQFAEGARRWLEAPSKKNPDISNADALVEQWGAAAFKNLAALSELLDRAEGRPQTGINLQVEDRRRDVVERAVSGLMAEAGMSREEALAELRKVAPDIEWEA
jgi:Family of unknown function (DUF5681)